MAKNVLKTCPFCGDDMASFAGMSEDAFAKGNDGTFSVACDCGVIGPSGKTMTEAVERWNVRVPGGN